MMDFIQQVERQLKKMSENSKDAWILSQAKLLPESDRTDFLMTLSGQKSAGSMPTLFLRRLAFWFRECYNALRSVLI